MVRKVTRKERNNRIEDDDAPVVTTPPAPEAATSSAPASPAPEAASIVTPAAEVTRADAEPEVAAIAAPPAGEPIVAEESSHPRYSADLPVRVHHEGTSDTLTEDQRRENIRNGAQGLRDLVDKYQEQHRVMQEEVAEAIIRDVQEQNQLHRLTANVLRLQQASLQNPEYTRWAYMNKKGEFSEEEDARRIAEAQERDRRAARADAADGSDDDDVVSNKSKQSRRSGRSGVSPAEFVANHLAGVPAASCGRNGATTTTGVSAREHPDGTNRYDKYVSDENRWMNAEVREYNDRVARAAIERSSSSSGASSSATLVLPPAITINLDAVNDRATLAYVKDPTAAPTEAVVVSKVPLPTTATSKKQQQEGGGGGTSSSASSPTSPPQHLLSPLEKADAKLQQFFDGVCKANSNSKGDYDEAGGQKEAAPSSSPNSWCYLPFLNGSILWPVAAVANSSLTTRVLTRMGKTTSATQTSAAIATRWTIACLAETFGNSHHLTTPLEHTLPLVRQALLAGDGADRLYDEGNTLVLAPYPIGSAVTGFEKTDADVVDGLVDGFVTVRAFTFKGVTKAIEVVDFPPNANPLLAAMGGGDDASVAASKRRLQRVVAGAVFKAAGFGCTTTSNGSEQPQTTNTKPSNIVRTFVVPLAMLFGGSTTTISTTAASTAVRLVDARLLNPAIPFGAHQGALSWTDLCGLARADIGSDGADAIVVASSSSSPVVADDPASTATTAAKPFETIIVRGCDARGANPLPLEPFNKHSQQWFPILNAFVASGCALPTAATASKTVDHDAAASLATIPSCHQQTSTTELRRQSASGKPADETNNATMAPPTTSTAPPQLSPNPPNSNKNNIELTPKLLASLGLGVTVVAAVCTFVGYTLAKQSDNARR